MRGFGERPRAERHARGWPIDRLAAASGVSRAMISKIERGESSPTAVVLGKLSAALELSVPELLSPAPAGGPGAAGRPPPAPQTLPQGGVARRDRSPPQ